jgi:proteasome lid subunit RPN8/RPN11
MQNFLKTTTSSRLKLRRLMRRSRERRIRSFRRPRLRFGPTAWAKLLFLRDRGQTEVGGFGITPADDLLYVEDVQLVRQSCTGVSVAFHDSAVAEFFDDQVDAGRQPEQFARIWIHTHPGESAMPSQVDEETYERVFGACDWAVMFILSCGGQAYCRLAFRPGPGGQFEIPVRIDFDSGFPASDFAAWSDEYARAVTPAPFQVGIPSAEGWFGADLLTDEPHMSFDEPSESLKPKRKKVTDERPIRETT